MLKTDYLKSSGQRKKKDKNNKKKSKEKLRKLWNVITVHIMRLSRREKRG